MTTGHEWFFTASTRYQMHAMDVWQPKDGVARARMGADRAARSLNSHAGLQTSPHRHPYETWLRLSEAEPGEREGGGDAGRAYAARATGKSDWAGEGPRRPSRLGRRKIGYCVGWDVGSSDDGSRVHGYHRAPLGDEATRALSQSI